MTNATNSNCVQRPIINVYTNNIYTREPYELLFKQELSAVSATEWLWQLSMYANSKAHVIAFLLRGLTKSNFESLYFKIYKVCV